MARRSQTLPVDVLLWSSLLYFSSCEGRRFEVKPASASPLSVTYAAPIEVTQAPPSPTPFLRNDLRRRAVQPTVAGVDGYSYLGCYQDGSNHILTITSLFDSGLTPELCKNVCSLASCNIFGLENGYECYCGTKIEPFAVTAPEGECSRSCWGQSTALCGAGARANVYSATGAGGAGNGGVTTATTTGGVARTSGGLSSSPSASPSTSSSGSVGAPGGGSGSNSPGSGSSGDSSGTPSGSVVISVGAIAGIAIGAAAVAAIITAALVWMLLRRKRSSPAPEPAMSYTNPPSMPPPSATFAQVPPGGDGGYLKPEYQSTPSYTAVSPGTTATPPTDYVSPHSPPPPQQTNYHEIQTSQPANPPTNYHEMQAPMAHEMPGGVLRRG